MKSQAEIYQALLDGKTLDNREFSCSLNKDGRLVDVEGDEIHLTFASFKKWQIYSPPKWYDNIPEGGVLCWVWDKYITNKEVSKIIDTQSPNCAGFKFISDECNWINATPLTKEEIQVFMDNASEVEGNGKESN